MGYEPNLTDMYKRAAALVDKILKGAKPADLPVEFPTRFEFIINLETAKALGMSVPQSLLSRADEEIDNGVLLLQRRMSAFGTKRTCASTSAMSAFDPKRVRKFRYRFVEPMMQPFVLMQGLRTGVITRKQVDELAATHYEPKFSSEF